MEDDKACTEARDNVNLPCSTSCAYFRNIAKKAFFSWIFAN